ILPTGSAEEDRAILATLYHATDGESWKKNDGWDTDANIGDWHGVSVDVDNRVVGLTLRYNNLSGEREAAELSLKLPLNRSLQLQYNK
ncbi:unnamed protein product, partial [Laminaria digitata]